MESLWRKESKRSGKKLSSRPVDKEKQRREVIVIGAGMAGILTAFYLQREGKEVLVLEAGRIASGQTEKTTAKITSQHDLKYSKLIRKVGIRKARMYAKANEEAISEYERLIRELNIECRFERRPAYLYTRKNKALLEEEERAASVLGIDCCLTKKTELPFPVAGALCFQNQAQFSPLEFLKPIAAKLEIWENTKVVKIQGKTVITEKGELQAENIVVATHYPFCNVPGFYFLRQHQERSYVVALSGCVPLHGMYYGIDKKGLSLRQAGEYLLLGGGGHRTGENKTGGSYDVLRRAAREYFPEGREVTSWSAQDCMPHDEIPFIGRFSLFTPHLYVATGFQKWGMTTSMAAALLLRDEICGKANPYKELFTPQRLNMAAGFWNLLLDVIMSVKGLTKGYFHRPLVQSRFIGRGHGGIVAIEGKRYACYRDLHGELHTISARCPHMGCELSWNPDEKSWDCPCHGSRFDIDGNLMDNPAKKNAEK